MTDVAIHRPPSRPVSVAGVVFIGLWVVFFVAVLFALYASADPERLQRYGPRIVSGFFVTIRFCAICLSVGALLSLPVAAALRSRNRIWRRVGFGYSYFFRGTPLIAQLFLIYYGAGQFSAELRAIGLWWFFRDAFNCALLSFALNTAAYQAEILAGALHTVARGQREAASALGLPRFTTLRKVVLPQALIVALGPYGNEVILIVKASAITSLVTVLDLMGETRYVFSQTYDLSFYLWAAVFYLIIVEAVRQISRRVGGRLTRHLGPAARKAEEEIAEKTSF